ncbi:MAG: glycosyltransferase family 4 protein [Saprospiraceae bacterium]
MDILKDTSYGLISVINNPESYFDRCYLLTQIGTEDLPHLILTNGKVANNNPKHCLVKTPPKTLRANKFWSWAFEQLKEIIQSYPKIQFILHEHGVGMVSAMSKVMLRGKMLRICSLYSGEYAFFSSRGWTIDPNGRAFITSAQKWKIIKSRFKPLLYRFVSVFGANIIIGNSSEAANELSSIFRFKQRYVMNTCILPERFAIEKPTPPQMKDTATRIQLLYAGKIYPAKGIGTLLKSFSLLEAADPNKYQLTMIGGIPNNDQAWFNSMLDQFNLKDKIKLLPKVPQEELIAYYQHADLFILPSFFEGSPRVMKEAIAAGSLVLCSNIAGTKIVDPTGAISFFFEPGNAAELKSKIQELSEAKAVHQARKAKGQAYIQAFSVANLAKERLQFYKKILKENER